MHGSTWTGAVPYTHNEYLLHNWTCTTRIVPVKCIRGVKRAAGLTCPQEENGNENWRETEQSRSRSIHSSNCSYTPSLDDDAFCACIHTVRLTIKSLNR